MSSSKSDITIAVVGGGLGGVCAAIALGRAGYTGGLRTLGNVMFVLAEYLLQYISSSKRQSPCCDVT
jgi:hypothetical protein